MKNILITIEYDGTNFSGWQWQPSQRTVQGELERVLSHICAMPIQINGASRTDAGVHALGQRAGFKGEFGIPTDRIMPAANHLLAGGRNACGASGAVRITAVEEKPPCFHARFDAVGKTYLYKIQNGSERNVFTRNYAYHVGKPLDVAAMKSAARSIAGTHDFKCFQASGGQERESTVRTIFNIDITEEPTGTDADYENAITISVTGDGFLYNMVRIIAGTLVDVGHLRLMPEAVSGIIESGERQYAGHTAPPQGLYLAKIYYDLTDQKKWLTKK